MAKVNPVHTGLHVSMDLEKLTGSGYSPITYSFRKRLERLEQDPDNLPTPRTVVKLGLARFLGEAHPELTVKSFPSEGLTERNFSHRPRLSPRDLVKDLEGSNKAIERSTCAEDLGG